MQPPTVDQAHEQLIGALQDMQSWEARARTAKDLLNDMLKSRREAAELATHYDIRSNLYLSSSLGQQRCNHVQHTCLLYISDTGK